MESNQSNVTTLPSTSDKEILSGLITRETRMIFNDVMSCGVQPVVTLVGLAGNILSIAVLGYQGVREVSSIILIGLAMADLLYLILWYGPMAECTLRTFDVVAAINMEVEYKAMPIMIASILGTVSRLYTCLIAVERYIAVLYPLRAPALLTRKRISVACVVLFALPFAFSFHLFLLFDVEEAFSSKYNATVKRVAFSSFAVENLDFMVLYNDLVLAVPFSYLPVLLVLYCTCSILLTLRRSQKNRLQMIARREDNKASAEKRQMTKTLVGICIVFIVCSLPAIILKVARLLFTDDGFSDVGRYRNMSYVAVTVSLLFSLINSSVNFIFYVAYSKKFAATARKMVLFWKKEESRRHVADKTPAAVPSRIQETNLS